MSYKTKTTYRPANVGPSDTERAAMGASIVRSMCAHGLHRAETDPDTGDEVCRFCGAVVE